MALPMFAKAKEETAKSYEAPYREGSLTDRRRSVLHEGITIKGDWSSDGIVEFGGTIVGDLTAETLVLTKDGKITGNVRAHTVMVEGQIEGTIAAVTVTIKSQARVNANIAAEVISVDAGAQMNGHLQTKAKA